MSDGKNASIKMPDQFKQIESEINKSCAETRVVSRVVAPGKPGITTAVSGQWHPDSLGNRAMLDVILASNVEIHGPDSCWIEERDATTVIER